MKLVDRGSWFVVCKKGWIFRLLLICAVAFLLFTIHDSRFTADACPMCKEALSQEGDKLTQGWARSIMLLMSAPYLLFAGVTTWIVRSARRHHRNTE